MVVNVLSNQEDKHADSELLAWLNCTLQSSFVKVEETCSGAAYCQLMDLLKPGCIDLKEVKFRVENEVDIYNNYKLLEHAFNKISIKEPLQFDSLIRGRFVETRNLLRWFKVFFDQNFEGQLYDPVVARGGQGIEPVVDKRPKAVAQLDFANEAQLLARDPDTLPGQVKEKGGTNMQTKVVDTFSCSLPVLLFICKHQPSVSASTDPLYTCKAARQVLGQKYPNDITASCTQTPYCLYMYHEVELMDGDTGSVILIGYFDQAAGKSKVRLLDVIEPMEEPSTTLLSCLLMTLKKFEIPLVNLAMFYSNAPDTTELVSGLKSLNPRTLFLCSLTDLAGQACCSGFMAMELSKKIQELLKNIHQHFSSLPASLKEQLKDMEDSNFPSSLTCDCVLLWTVVHKMTIIWSDLLQYFSSLAVSGNIKEICGFLSDKCLKACFHFLSHVLQPLCEFQKSWDCDSDMIKGVKDAFDLVHLYASSFLQPKSIDHFKRTCGPPRSDLMEHLPKEQVNVGEQVVEYLRQNDSELNDHFDLFYKSAISFYMAVSSSIINNLPLPELAFRNLALILSPDGKMIVTGKAVADLGLLFGVCPNAEDVNLLTDEFFEYQFTDRESSASPSGQSMGEYWRTELRIMGRTSIFKKLILSLLALPKSLRMESVFAQIFHTAGDDTLQEKEMDTSEEKIMPQDDDGTDSSSYKSAPSHPLSPEAQESVMSDVIDLTELEDETPMETKACTTTSGSEMQRGKQERQNILESIVIDDDDEDDDITDDDDTWTDIYPKPVYYKVNDFTSENNKEEMDHSCQVEEWVAVGEQVWGQVKDFAFWPGQVLELTKTEERETVCQVQWLGFGIVSKVHPKNLRPFSEFAQRFCPKSFVNVTTYKEAIFQSLQVAAAARCSEAVFSLESACKNELLIVLLDWAFGGFKTAGPNGLKALLTETRMPLEGSSNSHSASMVVCKPGHIALQKSNETHVRKKCGKLFELKEVSICLKNLSEAMDLQNGWVDLKDEEICKKLKWKEYTSRFVKAQRKQKYISKNKDHKKNQSPHVRNRACSRNKMVHEVLVNRKNIEDFCLSCGSENTETFHPLFEGSLCLKCKDNFIETLYRFDEDGYQSYCTVCCAGLEVILCGYDSCCRSYCVDCVDILVGQGMFTQLKDLDPWICYLCLPESSSGALKPRHDWSIRVQEFFANNSAMAFEPHRVYPSIPANLRRPIRVLSLFDGIATGYLVLKDLGFKVEKYVASEVDDESITISMVNHDGKITQVNDVRRITKEHIEKWGPFDLLIGGSPCNDLSIVNPARKGLFEGTGRLFFEYYRLLNIMKPKEDDPRPFFWLFENVVFMNNRDKADICRFLECNPVLVDAVKVSPAHRARYFWGNLPGMNRPITASQNDKLTLQECLEPGRTAKYIKVRTITTRANSLKQGPSDGHYPVTMNGKDDNIWITELEKIFGFPKHYTDVKNMGRTQRQKVLGKSWSVPVIRHLFAPLKDYFSCDEIHSECGDV
ncbi:uncharacterized protein [Hoplias malabaricus]|uniref:uncharacterized protein n=1 Tax=Hoplias malabaricus TaxID=27720 RepID=UPI0034632BFB